MLFYGGDRENTKAAGGGGGGGGGGRAPINRIIIHPIMEEGPDISRYWCHACSRIVSPIIEIESVKCPNCQGGFVEEMSPPPPGAIGNDYSDRALSLWAPILLGMMSNPRGRRPRARFRRLEFDNDDDDDHDEDEEEENNTELEHGLESIIHRRRRSSAAILQLLQGVRAGMLSEPEDDVPRARENRDGGGGVILINPFSQTIVVQGSSYDDNHPRYRNHNHSNQTTSSSFGSSLGDYFVGAGLDLLLQHLAENDPNRYGTPPAQKEAVEAMPTVRVDKALQCCVCLEDFEIGSEAKEMPCKHKFHGGCIVPWLELHSSCPVCRYQLPPSGESKQPEHINASDVDVDVDGDGDGDGRGGSSTSRILESGEEGGRRRSENAGRFSLPLPWPLSSLFSSSSGSQSSDAANNSSSAAATTTSSSSSSSSPEESSNSAAAPP